VGGWIGRCLFYARMEEIYKENGTRGWFTEGTGSMGSRVRNMVERKTMKTTKKRKVGK